MWWIGLWFVVAVVLALGIGRAIRIGDRRDAARRGRHRRDDVKELEREVG